MNVNTLRFKPGVRTSLNSGADIKPNFAKQKSGEGGLTAVGKTQSASRTAAANLSNSTLTNVNWQGQSGSIFGGRASQATSLLGNGTQRTSTTTTKSSTTIQRDNKYVSSGYWNKLQNDSNMGRSVYLGYTDYGYTRDFGSTGGTRRSGMRYDQRMNDYNQYVYDQLHPKTKKSFWQKLGDVVVGVAAGATAVAGIVGLFKGKKSGSAQQTTQGNAGSPTSTQGAGQGSPTSPTRTSTSSNQTIQNMENATNSDNLKGAIDGAKDEVQNISQDINKQKTEKANYKAKKSGLKAEAKRQTKEATKAEKEVKAHEDAAAKFNQKAEAAKGTIEVCEERKTSLKNQIDTNKKYIQSNEDQITNLNSQVSELESSNENGVNNKQIAELKSQIKKLEKQNTEYKNANDKMENETIPKLDKQIKKAEREQLDAEQGAARETKLAEQAQEKAKSERDDAEKAEQKLIKNEANIAATEETIADLKTERTDVKESISEQKDRYKDMLKEEKKAEKKAERENRRNRA